MRSPRAVMLLVGTLTLLTLFRSGQLLNLSEWQSTAAATKSLRQAGNSKVAHLGQEMESLRQENARLKSENERLKSEAVSGKANAKQQVEQPAKQAVQQPQRPQLSAEGRFLVASVEPEHAGDAAYLRQLLRSLLGMAVLLKRTLVLPAALCNCRDAQLTRCEGEAKPPFDCPLREALRTERWLAHPYLRDQGVELRPARFVLEGAMPERLRTSHVRVLLPDGMDDSEMAFALRQYDDALLEVQRAHKAYCGWDVRLPGNTAKLAAFDAAADELLETVGGGAPAARLHRCEHYRGGTGEVLQFTNVGQAGSKHAVTASRDKLPASVRDLPANTDIMVTFATGSVSEMACNWVKNVQNAGVQEVLIGALDQGMMDACAKQGVPCVLVDGGAVTAALATRRAQNVREDPTLYPKMSVLKVGFYRELLSFGFNVWACDADAVFMNDPRPMMREGAWAHADVAIATDCIDLPSDARYPLLHCDFNTGLVYLRSRPVVLDFVERWRDTVANAKETRIRDQAAFNMLTKARPLQQYKEDGQWLKRIFTSTISGIGQVRIGVLPLAQYLNGHTYFVQHAHTLPSAAQPLSVHMTYQFAEGSKFAYGKRQRLREAGLWLVDDDAYYNGRYVTVSAAAANLPVKPMGVGVDSRDAVTYHLEESAHRAKVIRTLIGIGKATGRDVILPRMLCYCDFMWKEMRNCRVGGAESMRLPFDCPMDHVLDTPRFFESGFGVGVREANFLKNPRVPANVSSSVARVSLPKGLNDVEVLAALKPHEGAAIIELDDAVDRFCGFDAPAMNDAYRREGNNLLSYSRTPFCMMEGSNNAPLFSQCCSPRKPGDKFFPCISGSMPNGADLPTCAHPAV